MPTYSYSCNDCGADHDIVQSMSDPTLTECPSCGGTMRKLFTNVGVVFKGSGFYRTDSRDKKSGGDATQAEKKAEKKADSGASSSAGSSTSSSTTSSSGGTSSGSTASAKSA